MQILRRGRLLLAVIGAVIAAVYPAALEAQSCIREFYHHVVGPQGLPWERAQRLFRTFNRFGQDAQEGVVAILASSSTRIGEESVDEIIENFTVVVDYNPLRTAEGIFAAVGRLSRPTMPEGLDEVIDRVAKNLETAEKGGLGELAVADGLMSQGRGVAGFQRPVTVNGETRVYDVVSTEPAGGGLPGIVHEVKNWTTRLVGPHDGRLADLAGEFRRDIRIHQATGFQFLRIDLRATVRDDSVMIRDRLVQEIADVFANNPTEATRVQGLFIDRWNSGRLVLFF